jgi:hypothetical protein
MKHIIHVLLILICVAALVGCKDKTSSSDDTQKTEPNISEANEPRSSEITPTPPAEPNVPPPSGITPTPPADSFVIAGTVTYKNIEGGFYAIDGDNGSKYDPISLPEAFRNDGLKVKITARRRTDAVSFHMYGSIIEVVNIAVR